MTLVLFGSDYYDLFLVAIKGVRLKQFLQNHLCLPLLDLLTVYSLHFDQAALTCRLNYSYYSIVPFFPLLISHSYFESYSRKTLSSNLKLFDKRIFLYIKTRARPFS